MISQITPDRDTSSNCGPGQWYRVAHLNMSDPSKQCPSSWRKYNTSGVRGCERPATSSGSCPASFYATSRQYSRMCGGAIGYKIGSTDAFGNHVSSQLESYYVYGISITHGTPRNHIWTYAAGLSERGYHTQSNNCPCSKPSYPYNALPPSFVGDNYYYESGNPTDTFILTICIVEIFSRMVSSVKVSVAAMEISSMVQCGAPQPNN